MVDQRRHEQPRRLACARDGEGAAAQVLRLQRSRVGAVGEAFHLGVELVERQLVGAVHDGNDEPLLGLHRDADVVAVEQHELCVLDPRVQLRELAERLGDGVEDERDEALQVDVREVALLHPGHGRDLAVRAREVLEHLATDAAQLDALALGRRRRLAAACRGADVLLGDASLRAAAGHAGEVDAELGRDLAHERSRANLLAGRGPRRLLLRRGLGARLLLVLRLGRGAVAADHDEDGADGHDLAFGDEDPGDGSARRRRDLDRRLVGRDLDERRVLRDLLAFGDEPARDLALGQALAEVRKLELVRHEPIPSGSRRRGAPRGRP